MQAVWTRSQCLTRVMTDDDVGIEMAQVAAIVQRIQRSLAALPAPERDYVARALLAQAMNRVQTGR